MARRTLNGLESVRFGGHVQCVRRGVFGQEHCHASDLDTDLETDLETLGSRFCRLGFRVHVAGDRHGTTDVATRTAGAAAESDQFGQDADRSAQPVRILDARAAARSATHADAARRSKHDQELTHAAGCALPLLRTAFSLVRSNLLPRSCGYRLDSVAIFRHHCDAGATRPTGQPKAHGSGVGYSIEPSSGEPSLDGEKMNACPSSLLRYCYCAQLWRR